MVTVDSSPRVLLICTDPHLGLALEQELVNRQCVLERAFNNAEGLKRVRCAPYDVVITDPATTIEDDLALFAGLRYFQPKTKVIVLAPAGTSDDILSALRRDVFFCKCAPFSASEIADYARAATSGSREGFQILSASKYWISVRMNASLFTGDRLLSFLKQLQSELPKRSREELMTAVGEMVRNAIEHGTHFDSLKFVEIAAVRTRRSIVFYISDPGEGFRLDAIPHAAVSNTADAPAQHIHVRESHGMRPGGYGILLSQGIVDELIYNEKGNQVLLIKYLDPGN